MKRTILSFTLIVATTLLFAQKKTTTSAIINFDATTILDNLPKAENKTVIASLDTKTGELAFEASIKNFAFSNPRIQGHFNNATWMDSDKFPTSTFTGTITNLKSVNFAKDGKYNAEVKGDLSIHGITKSIETAGTITVIGKTINATAEFSIKLEDYGVNGPAIGAGKVAKDPKIIIAAEF